MTDWTDNTAIEAMVTPAGMTGSKQLRIVCHENAIPAFVEPELERLYGSVFSSLAHYRIYGGAENANTYVVRDGQNVSVILLFRREQRTVQVINEWIQLTQCEILRFASYIFDRYPSIDRISWHAVDIHIDRLPYPSRRFPCTDDSVLTLPPSAEAYLAQLGKTTRKNIRRYTSRLKQRFPSFRYRILERGDIDERHVHAIIGFNRIRMARKGRTSGIDEQEAKRMLQLLKERGFVGIATIDGDICAGALTYRFGGNYYSFVRAHDPRYDDLRLGVVGGYLLIAECIARGGKEFHFMWGHEDHKSILNGVHRDLSHLTIYRSRLRLLMDGREILTDAAAVALRRLRMRLQSAQAGAGLLHALRKLKKGRRILPAPE